ncbi:FAD-binding oxidoreductase [Tropicimonas isoalkanivorans]|uniref:FAD/FMN-containing dehydrogenase n=1 Tax=Tropicimonas isoalkanivorans TaxID=441112 RepID=A0A1I1MWC5_9RHOB|nr:FAD-binding oxidoreductase [Tropicimonas isoalkanivorans]SFC85850.1 FAD/FMN-containing dehydrogenase [Tropicimonas isoalkanivorans]
MTAQSPSELRDLVRGQVITPEDAEYEGARKVHNGMIDKRPAVIVRAANTGDVITTVRYARETGLDLAVRGGGHSGPGFGTCDGGVVCDLSMMRGVRVDPGAKTARAGGGTTWGDFNAATHAFGLATTGGLISTTGIAGLTLGGGVGYLTRGCGLSLDNLISADVVTADGEMLIASETENADLFWAIRGGGGNFGVCTSLKYRLQPIGTVYWGPMFYEIEEAENILKFFDDYITDAPRDMGAFPAFQIAPPLPFIPEDRHGDMFAAIVACWSGDPEEGERQFKAFHDVAEVKAEHVGPVPYPAINMAFDGLFPTGTRQYWKGNFVQDLNDEAIAVHAAHGAKAPTVSSTMHLYPVNGACHDVAPDATAYGHRDAKYSMVIISGSDNPADDAPNKAWVRDYADAIAPYSEAGGYINFMDADDSGRTTANFGANHDRLVQIKRKYDPDNVFHLNQNIVP